jgi:ribosome-associated translation inhibitor RaiA
MKIQVNTDKNIEGSEELVAHIETVVENSLRHFRNQITRVEIHFRDENSHKSGRDDKRCMMEARLEGRQPVAVTHQAGSVSDAVEGAAKKMKASLESTLGKLNSY